ncbi:hypothetical protein GF325_13245 [Candidatus Bathyarchaeota archaeon]|nr:hypothetical protein [Candidatus Bathyarchaeota archaeon]
MKKGFICITLGRNGSSLKVVREIQKLLDVKDYCCSTQGKYGIVIEKNMEELSELDEFLTTLRTHPEISGIILKTITFLGIRA